MTDATYRRFTGDNWSYGDPKVGYDVPMSVRRGGAYRPHLKRELSGNGTAYEAHSAAYECEGCGDVRRFATSELVTSYWCDECSDVRWFRFDWDLNRRSVGTGVGRHD